MPVIPQPSSFRTSFDEVAQEYDTIRPGYPPALFHDIMTLATLPAQAHILEIGCGTGQATTPFAQRGDLLTCLDIGAAMLAIARQNFAAYPNVRFQQATFEAWSATPRTFDLVMSATAFHWIPPEIGYPKAAQILKDTGALAIFSNEHPPATGFFAELQGIFQRIIPEQSHEPPPLEASITATAAMIDATRLFEPVIVKTYPWTQTYTTPEYLRLLNTYSPNRNLDASRRTQLFHAIAELIDTKYGGTVTKPYLAVLYLARKRST